MRTIIYSLAKWISNGLIIGLLCFSKIIRCDPANRPSIRLNDVIKEGYDNFQTPQEEGAPANVSIQIAILNIRNVDVSEMSLIADIFLHMAWQDKRLVYPADKKTVRKVSLHPSWRKHLWTPDIYFHNAIEGKVMDTGIPYLYLWLRNDSQVVLGTRLSLEFSCDMLLHNFPHDTQTCDIILKSFTHTRTEMNLHWRDKDSFTVGDFIYLPQFEYLPPRAAACKEQHMTGKHGKYACLRGVIQLTRRAGYYVINIYIPSILIVFMSMLTFWIPVDAVPGRVTLGVTSLLTIITKQDQAALPSVSYVVALNVWLSVCIGFVFCSLLEYAALVAIVSHQKRMATEDKATCPNSETDRHSEHNIAHIVYTKLIGIDVVLIDRVCRVLFPVIFALHCTTYWIFYTKINPN